MSALKILFHSPFYKANLILSEEPSCYKNKKIVSSKIVNQKYTDDVTITKIIFDYDKIIDEKNIARISLIECGCKTKNSYDNTLYARKKSEIINPINCINCKYYDIKSFNDLPYTFIKYVLYDNNNDKPNFILEMPFLIHYLLNKHSINIISRKISATRGPFTGSNIRDLWIAEENGKFVLINITSKFRNSTIKSGKHNICIDKLNNCNANYGESNMQDEHTNAENISEGVTGLNFSILNDIKIPKFRSKSMIRYIDQLSCSCSAADKYRHFIHNQLTWIKSTINSYTKEKTRNIILDLFSDKICVYFNNGLVELIISYVSVIEN